MLVPTPRLLLMPMLMPPLMPTLMLLLVQMAALVLTKPLLPPPLLPTLFTPLSLGTLELTLGLALEAPALAPAPVLENVLPRKLSP